MAKKDGEKVRACLLARSAIRGADDMASQVDIDAKLRVLFQVRSARCLHACDEISGTHMTSTVCSRALRCPALRSRRSGRRGRRARRVQSSSQLVVCHTC